MTQPAQSSDYCAKCHLMILQPNVNYGINPDAVCKCPSAPAQSSELRCEYCEQGFELKPYLDGSLRHFDGLMAWHPCAKRPVAAQSSGHEWTAGVGLPTGPSDAPYYDCCKCGWHCLAGSDLESCRVQHAAHVASVAQAAPTEEEQLGICGIYREAHEEHPFCINWHPLAASPASTEEVGKPAQPQEVPAPRTYDMGSCVRHQFVSYGTPLSGIAEKDAAQEVPAEQRETRRCMCGCTETSHDDSGQCSRCTALDCEGFRPVGAQPASAAKPTDYFQKPVGTNSLLSAKPSFTIQSHPDPLGRTMCTADAIARHGEFHTNELAPETPPEAQGIHAPAGSVQESSQTDKPAELRHSISCKSNVGMGTLSCDCIPIEFPAKPADDGLEAQCLKQVNAMNHLSSPNQRAHLWAAFIRTEQAARERAGREALTPELVERALQDRACYDINDELDSTKLCEWLLAHPPKTKTPGSGE